MAAFDLSIYCKDIVNNPLFAFMPLISGRWLRNDNIIDVSANDKFDELSFDSIYNEIKQTGNIYIDFVLAETNAYDEIWKKVNYIFDKFTELGICESSFEHKSCMKDFRAKCMKINASKIFNLIDSFKFSDTGLDIKKFADDELISYDIPLAIMLSKDVRTFDVLIPAIKTSGKNNQDVFCGCSLMSKLFDCESYNFGMHGEIKSYVLANSNGKYTPNEYGIVHDVMSYQSLMCVRNNYPFHSFITDYKTAFPLLVSGSAKTVIKQHCAVALQYANDFEKLANYFAKHADDAKKEYDSIVNQLHIDYDMSLLSE